MGVACVIPLNRLKRRLTAADELINVMPIRAGARRHHVSRLHNPQESAKFFSLGNVPAVAEQLVSYVTHYRAISCAHRCPSEAVGKIFPILLLTGRDSGLLSRLVCPGLFSVPAPLSVLPPGYSGVFISLWSISVDGWGGGSGMSSVPQVFAIVLLCYDRNTQGKVRQDGYES